MNTDLHAPIALSCDVALAEVFPRNAILPGLEVQTKRAAIEELIHHLAAIRPLGHDDERVLVHSLLAREDFGSTGIGRGIAIPHCRTSAVDKIGGVIGLSRTGVPFNAIDGELVHCFFLLVTPRDRNDIRYRVLGRIAAIRADRGQCMRLQGCLTQDEAYRFLCELDRL